MNTERRGGRKDITGRVKDSWLGLRANAVSAILVWKP